MKLHGATRASPGQSVGESLLESVNEDGARIMRQALAGMLWSKPYFGFDLDAWLTEHGQDPMHRANGQMRNSEWFHMGVISMLDKWEYPWYAAWDLAFHAIALSAVDVDFAKEQLELMLSEYFLHPSGQIPRGSCRIGLCGSPTN